MQSQIKNITSPYVIVVIPLLIETGQSDQVDHILLVDCPEDMQIERVKHRDNRDEQQIKDILHAQSSRQARLSTADDVIENRGDISELDAKIELLHQKFLSMSQDRT